MNKVLYQLGKTFSKSILLTLGKDNTKDILFYLKALAFSQSNKSRDKFAVYVAPYLSYTKVVIVFDNVRITLQKISGFQVKYIGFKFSFFACEVHYIRSLVKAVYNFHLTDYN